MSAGYVAARHYIASTRTHFVEKVAQVIECVSYDAARLPAPCLSSEAKGMLTHGKVTICEMAIKDISPRDFLFHSLSSRERRFSAQYARYNIALRRAFCTEEKE